MGKYTNVSKLSKKRQNELFALLAQALGKVKNSVEAANFVRDLFTEQEAIILARRLQIAELLDSGFTYQQIRKVTNASNGTIARIQLWLNTYGEGCRTLLKRISKNSKKNSINNNPLSWRQLKKKYPMYFWPELILDEIIRNAGKREKERLVKVISEMKEKTKLTKQLLTLLS